MMVLKKDIFGSQEKAIGHGAVSLGTDSEIP
jgi:hypothetical protein